MIKLNVHLPHRHHAVVLELPGIKPDKIGIELEIQKAILDSEDCRHALRPKEGYVALIGRLSDERGTEVRVFEIPSGFRPLHMVNIQ